MQKLKNFAFIDGQNLNLSIKDLGWSVDLKKLRIYLKDKYNVQVAYYFIGYIKENENLYNHLRSYGYKLIFKKVSIMPDGKPKGNVDAELVLHTLDKINKYNKAIIVSNDGDFACLVKYLSDKNKLEVVLSPNKNKCSVLLRKATGKRIDFINDKQAKLGLKTKRTLGGRAS